MENTEKYRIRIFLICMLFFLHIESIESKWESHSFKTINEDGSFQFLEHENMIIDGIQIPSKTTHNKNHQCQYRKIKHFISDIFKEYPPEIKIKSKNIIDIRIQKKRDFAEILLDEGFGFQTKANSLSKTQLKKRTQKETQAQKNKKGIWGNCTEKSEKTILKTIWGSQFLKKYSSYISPISVGKVQSVQDGKTIILKNGLPIELIGVGIPPKENAETSETERCFSRYAKKYLEHLLLYKTVFLEKDISDLSEKRRLRRYIKLPLMDKGQTEIFINQKMIEDGFAQSEWNPQHKDTYYKKTFEAIQKEVYQHPKGAWRYCFQ